jgi:hypothetical protein
MPTLDEYEYLTLSSALSKLAEHHFAHKRRHISRDEYLMLLAISEFLEDTAPAKLVFSLNDAKNSGLPQNSYEIALAKKRLNQLTKTESLSQISEVLGIDASLSPGSTVPSSVYHDICKSLGLKTPPDMLKQELAKWIVESSGDNWLPSFTSAGSTVTGEGLSAILFAAKTLKPKAEIMAQIYELLGMEEDYPPNSTVPTADLYRIGVTLGLPVRFKMKKVGIARLIVESSGFDWLGTYMSSANIVTLEGLTAILSASKNLKYQIEQNLETR